MLKSVFELVRFLESQGMPCEVDGDAARIVRGVSGLEDAGPDEITFLANRKYERLLGQTRAGAVLVSPHLEVPAGCCALRVRDPYEAFARLTVFLHGYRRHAVTGVSPLAQIDASVAIGPNAAVAHGVTLCAGAVIGRNAVFYPGVYVGPRCRIGDDCVLYPNVVIYEDCVLGHRVALHAGTVIGEDGLGYAPVGEKWHKIPQVGIVEIGDDVEIGANCAIDRATVGKTVIASGTKFSNLVAIGHGTKVGANCMFVAQVGVAGSVVVGRHVTLAGKAGVAGHLTIGDNARVGGMAGVMRDVPADTEVLGAPALEISEARRVMSASFRLPELRERVRELEAEVSRMRERLDAMERESAAAK